MKQVQRSKKKNHYHNDERNDEFVEKQKSARFVPFKCNVANVNEV